MVSPPPTERTFSVAVDLVDRMLDADAAAGRRRR